MTQKIAALVSFLAILAFVALPAVTHAGGLEIGATAENFTLPDTDGKTQTLDGLKARTALSSYGSQHSARSSKVIRIVLTRSRQNIRQRA
jgi:hypothetical protein